MKSKERLKATLNHQATDKVVVDFGATPTTGIHVLALKKLRDYFGLDNKPIKVIEPYQMLGEVDDELIELLGVDVIGISPSKCMFGFENNNWKPFKTFWGQDVLVPGNFNTTIDGNGDLLIYPEGDLSAPASGKMPVSGYFFDGIIRQQPFEEEDLRIEDNLEEFSLITDEELRYWAAKIEKVKESGKGIVANFGGTALGDIALVPAPGMKYPKGIRDITEWYMSSLLRPGFLKEIFDRQSDIAVENLKRIFGVVGNHVDVVFMCGNDFGTQNSTFCDSNTFAGLYLPYYRKMNDWIHANTTWKTFKHSCGAVEPLIDSFVEAGFDILNPVQVNATGMDPQLLKEKHGQKIVFWGGGIDTQKVLSFGTPQQVKEQVKMLVDIFSKNGGYVFNTIHNLQADVPIENIAAMLDALNEINR